VLAGPETGPDRNREQVGEVALRELGTNIGAVARFLEQVCVRVEGHAGAGVPEDAADLKNVEADVDDQVAGEGVAQIVEAHPSARPIEPRATGGAAEDTLGDVVVEKRRAAAGREHVVGAAREAGTTFVFSENCRELGEERDLTDGGVGLRCDPVWRNAAAAARELTANVDDGCGEATSRQLSASTSERRMPVNAPVKSSGR
jgi:hypothetical protein